MARNSGPRQYRRAGRASKAKKVAAQAEGGGPGQYRRAKVEVVIIEGKGKGKTEG